MKYDVLVNTTCAKLANISAPRRYRVMAFAVECLVAGGDYGCLPAPSRGSDAFALPNRETNDMRSAADRNLRFL